MKNNRWLFGLSAAGVLIALFCAFLFSRQREAQPPAFKPASNPFEQGIYANGIIESYQSHGENINLYPEVSGRVTQLAVAEGDEVKQGAVLLVIDDAVQRATAAQLHAQADAARTALDAMKAQPRPENLAVAGAQVDSASANLKNAEDQLSKVEHFYALDPQSISRDAVDNARNAAAIAAAALEVARKQYDLIKAGAWHYDIANQEKQYQALAQGAAAADALLDKYTLRAPVDGVILAVQAARGGFVSSQGVYSSYTQGFMPVVVMSTPQDRLEVRSYIDEILVPRLPPLSKMTARMFVRGSDLKIPLTFVRTQPYVSPKIELTTERQERVDVRVLPVVFSFDVPRDAHLYPGQLVDVYISGESATIGN
jgi:HlyD family secretion protein